ncbi:MAG: DapH/DapD/GlmU-related protein [Paracoccaceae bacterium]
MSQTLYDYWDDAGRDEAFFEHRRSRTAQIGHDTWIGASAMIKPEVTLGHGAVVAAGSVVTKDVDPYTIVAGTPAKPLRLRQPRAVADRLIALAWWDWSHDDIHKALDDFRGLNATTFLEKHE